ncbi:MAG TPA: ImmA/IrrE family metallo-endopeptidase [Nakamurella sp.]
MIVESDRLLAARRRRALGTVQDFDGQRLALARRLKRKQRAVLARDVDVTAAAICQFEKGQSRPTTPVLARLALALGVPTEFFRRGRPIEAVSSTAAHFRSLRSTPAISRDQALAFAEIALAVVDLIEQYVDLPALRLPVIEIDDNPGQQQIAAAAGETRRALGIPVGPVAHVVRLLEAGGAVVVRLPSDVDRHVDAFSTDAGPRPLVLLSPLKDDKARSRFDGSHELGHLVMHRGAEPGSRIVENQAHSFAAEFLMPAEQIADDLPRRVDWEQLHVAKKKWGVSLKALAYRAHRLELWSDQSFRRANQYLATVGLPEPGPLGPPESPSLLGQAAGLLAHDGTSLAALAVAGGLPLDRIQQVVEAGSERRPKLLLGFDPPGPP